MSEQFHGRPPSPLQRALHWLAATHVLAYDDLLRVAWTTATDRRVTSRERLQWEREGFLQPLTADGALYTVGLAGAELLGREGINSSANKAYRGGLGGLVFASRFAVALAAELAQDGQVGMMTWWNNAHRGLHARADGDVVIWLAPSSTYDERPNKLPREICQLWVEPDPPPYHDLRFLFLEFDSGTETEAMIEQRAENWRRRVAAYPFRGRET